MGAIPTTTGAVRIVQRFALGAWRWTETYYYAQATGSLVSQIAIGKGLNLLRLICLSSGASLLSTRVTWFLANGKRDLSQGSTLLKTDRYGCGTGLYDPGTKESSIWTDVAFRFQDQSALYHRTAWIRGIPRKGIAWAKDGSGVLTADGNLQVTEFVTVLYNVNRFLPVAVSIIPGTPAQVGPIQLYTPRGVFAIRGRLAPPLVPAATKILAMAPNPLKPCWTDVTLTAPLAVEVGDTVHIHGVTGCVKSGLNGDRKVVDVQGNVVTIGTTTCCCSGPVVNPGGTMALVSYAFFAISPSLNLGAFEPYEISLRKTGGSPGKTRGRGKPCCRRG